MSMIDPVCYRTCQRTKSSLASSGDETQGEPIQFVLHPPRMARHRLKRGFKEGLKQATFAEGEGKVTSLDQLLLELQTLFTFLLSQLP
jgi:hypothetical protein